GLDGRRPGVAAGGADDGDALVPGGEHVVEEAPDELQGDVLEGEGGSVEQLGDPLPVVDLHEGDDGVVAERAVGVGAHGGDVGGGDVVADERLDHGGGDLGVARARVEALGRRQLGPRGRHVEAAVGGEP